jgi:PAS domain S-box-containing protein
MSHEASGVSCTMKSLSTSKHRLFVLKILLPAVLALGLFVISLYQFIIPHFEDIILGRKREMIRELTFSAWHVLDRFHAEQRAGTMDEAEAKAAAIAQVSHLRYGDEGKDYFWITDHRPFMVDHPFREDLNGTDLSDFTDSRGKRLFVEMVEAVRPTGDGFVDYTWQWKDDSTRIVPKLSYVKSFEPWGWIIGTGIYLEDVRAQIEGLERDVVRISLYITVTIALLLALIVLQNLRSERRRKLAEDDLREAKEKYEALVEASTEGLLMLLDGAEPYMNTTLRSMSGYSDEEARKLTWPDLLPDIPLDTLRAGSDAEDTSPKEVEGPSQAETRLRRSDGSFIDVLLSASEVHFFGKTGTVVIVRDIGQHKEISNALDETREKFLSLTSQLPLAVFRTDAAKGMPVLEGNAAAAEILGHRSVAGLLGVDFAAHFADAQAFTALADELYATGMISHRIVRMRRADDRRVSLAISIALLRDDDGQPRYCDILAEDRSEESDEEERTRRLLSDMQTPLLFLSQAVRTLMREATVCGMRYPVSGVVRLMTRSGSEAALLRDDAGETVGIIGIDELRDALLHRDRPGELIAHEIMRSPLLRISEAAAVQEALTLMRDTQVRTLAVVNPRGEVTVVLGLEDIHRSSLHSYLHVLRQLQSAESPAEIGQERRQLVRSVAMLINGGAGVRHITHALTAINDAAVHRVLALALEKLGPPPCEFAFLALGSEGRREQTLATDQDNAIIYADVHEADGEYVDAWFRTLGDFACRALNEAGYPYCKGDVMAMNPKWCRPLSAWKRYFTDWITTSNPQDLLEISIFFDFRCIHGDETLGERLRDHVFDTSSGYHSFFAYLAQNALRIKPPSWQFKSAETTDVKLAMLPIVDLARIYALRHRVRATNTPERLERLNELGVFSSAGYRDIAQSYELLLSLRFRNQARAVADNAPAHNMLSGALLTDIDKAALRKAFTNIETFQSKMSVDFRGTL